MTLLMTGPPGNPPEPPPNPRPTGPGRSYRTHRRRSPVKRVAFGLYITVCFAVIAILAAGLGGLLGMYLAATR